MYPPTLPASWHTTRTHPVRAVKKCSARRPSFLLLFCHQELGLPRPSDLRTGGGCLSAMSERTAAHRGARRRTRAGHRGAWPTRFTHRPTRGSLVGLSQLAKAAESVLKRRTPLFCRFLDACNSQFPVADRMQQSSNAAAAPDAMRRRPSQRRHPAQNSKNRTPTRQVKETEPVNPRTLN